MYLEHIELIEHEGTNRFRPHVLLNLTLLIMGFGYYVSTFLKHHFQPSSQHKILQPIPTQCWRGLGTFRLPCEHTFHNIEVLNYLQCFYSQMSHVE